MAVVLAHGLHHERQAQAAPDRTVGGLRRPAAPNTSSSSPAGTPAPESDTRTVSPAADPAARPRPPAGARSLTASMRVVDQVAQDRHRVALLDPAGAATSVPVVDAAAARRARRPARSCRAAARTRTGSPTEPTTRSVSSWATSSSSVAKSSASSVRPSSTSDTTVCSRLAASWFCERSDSASPRTVSSSPGDAPGSRCGRAASPRCRPRGPASAPARC